LGGWRWRSRGCFASPAKLPLQDYSPYRGLHLRREHVGVVPHSAGHIDRFATTSLYAPRCTCLLRTRRPEANPASGLLRTHQVTEQVVGYQKMNVYSDAIISEDNLELPARDYITRAVRLEVPPQVHQKDTSIQRAPCE
jgi:hypothetical protein